MNTETITLSSDPVALQNGARLAKVRGCEDCHGENLAGKVLVDDPALGALTTANLTRGKGGVASSYTGADQVRALRHGVKPNGKPAIIMPAHE